MNQQPVDPIALVRDVISRPRGRACVVLTRDYQGQKAWAETLAVRTGAKYLDLQSQFLADDELAGRLDTFTVAELFSLLRKHGDCTALVISGLEFLTATWAGLSKSGEEFARRVETWDAKPALVFVLQHDPDLAAYKFTRYPQHVFVVEQDDTLALT